MSADVYPWETELVMLEHDINISEGEGIRARWMSGRFMLNLREGKKQLPRGVRATLTGTLGVHASEITARLKLAEKCPTESELADVISTFRTWFAITHQALTTTRREPRPRTSGLPRILEVIENVDPAILVEADRDLLSQIEAGIRRIKTALVTLGKEAA